MILQKIIPGDIVKLNEPYLNPENKSYQYGIVVSLLGCYRVKLCLYDELGHLYCTDKNIQEETNKIPTYVDFNIKDFKRINLT